MSARAAILCALLASACGSSAPPQETPPTETPFRSDPSPRSTNASFSEPIGTSDDPDMDGIVSSADLCPSDPEDRDGFQDQDGCPDPDNDQDNILDMDDRCPNDPETYNGMEDQDGCPDGSLPAPVS